MPKYDRRGFLRLTGAAATTSALASACSGSSLGGEEAGKGGPVKIGLILPQGGVYKALGDDQRNGWNLYLELNKNRLGGHEVTVVTADESEKPEVTKANAEKLLKKDKCLVVAGMISSGNIIPVQQMYTEAKVPFLSTNASPTPIQYMKYGWRSSFQNVDPTLAIAPYVAKHAGGPISVITANYAAGQDHIKALDKAFKPAGGRLAGEPILTPFPIGGESFQPYLKQIEKQRPKAVYCFFGGADAVKFVKEYQQFGLADKFQLYAPGWLTEGGVLGAQGEAATGILNSLNYSADLDNAANRKFVAEYQRKYAKAPTCFAVAAYDAAWILDKAIAAAGDELTSERLEKEIGNVGQIDSPRGPWEFGTHRSPVQKWYLREVKKDGDVLANVVIDELSTVGIE